ncbi:MAG: ABC transporter permease [Acidobacteriota bacterium]|nr:ABC transporter permease [Acidobacteriota bacterium]
MESLLQDLRFGLRSLGRSKGFTLAVLVSLVLGIGTTTAVFSVVNGVVLKPLPYAQPDRLMTVWTQFLAVGLERNYFSGPEYQDLLDGANADRQVFDGIAGYYSGSSVTVTGGETSQQLTANLVTPDFFRVLGVEAERGRTFLPEEGTPGRSQAVVLSYGFWQRRFGGDTNVLENTLSIDGEPHSVVGVMPAGFFFDQEADLWMPLVVDPADLGSRGGRYIEVVARLADGVSRRQAQEASSLVAQQLARQYPDNYPVDSGWGMALIPLHEQVVGDVGAKLWVLLGAVAFLLLIACANVSNLILARTQSRLREISLRSALGADRWRIFRQFLTEMSVLSGLGGLVGLLLAFGALQLIKLSDPEQLPRVAELSLDGQVVLFALVVSALVALLLSAVPSLQLSRLNLNETLKAERFEGHSGVVDSRTVLVVVQVGLVLVLLVSSGLLIKSFLRLQEVSPGFEPRDLLSMELSLPTSQLPEDFQVRSFVERLSEEMNGLPGVAKAGVTSQLPLSGSSFSNSFLVEGQPFNPGDIPPEGQVSWIHGDYFQAMGIALLDGRVFRSSDDAEAPLVAVVDKSLAQRFWPDESPVGKRVTIEGPEGPWIEVVGMVDHVKQEGLEASSRVQMYFPFAQGVQRGIYLVLRTETPPAGVIAAARQRLTTLDSDLAFGDVRTMEQRLADSLSERRFSMAMVVAFAVIGLLLAGVGIYSVMTYVVNQRRRDVGIRMALGAKRADVFRLMIGRGLRAAAVGVVFGLVAAWLWTRTLESMLFGVGATDVGIFVLVSVLLLTVASIATLVPARRATRVDPLQEMRHE